jgi:imidazole glycerol phosphate synthase glutamine amidotransferase subunit
MMSPELIVVPTGTANTASVLAAFKRLGARPRIGADPREIERAPFVVLPGVGAFGAAARRLDELQLRDVLCRRMEAGAPTLAICLGLHLLCAESEESPGVPGLGLVPATVRRFPIGLRVPQLGWNRVDPIGGDLIEAGHAYFANSFRLQELPAGWSGAVTEYGSSFVSALERGAVLACQFHPELSGAFGARLLARWMQRGLEVA